MTLPARRELGAVLAAPTAGHPWPAVLPANRFGQWSSSDVAYTQVQPSVVVEIAADASFEHGRWRHPTKFVRYRADLDPLIWTPDYPTLMARKSVTISTRSHLEVVGAGPDCHFMGSP